MGRMIAASGEYHGSKKTEPFVFDHPLDHDRAVALCSTRAVRTQLSRRVETTREQMVKAKNRLTPTTIPKTGPGFWLMFESLGLSYSNAVGH